MYFNMTCAVFDSVVVFGEQRLIPRATTIMNTQESEGGKGSFINFIKCSCAHMHSTSLTQKLGYVYILRDSRNADEQVGKIWKACIPQTNRNTYLTCFLGELNQPVY